MRINSSPSLIFSRSDSISAGVNISPDDIAFNLMGSRWGVLSWVKRKLGLHKQLALLCVHPLAPGTQQKNAATRTKWLAARVFPVWKDWILVHTLQNNGWVGQALSYTSTKVLASVSLAMPVLHQVGKRGEASGSRAWERSNRVPAFLM